MSLRAIASLRLGLGWVSKELKTEPSFMSDKMDRIASQVKKEDGEQRCAQGIEKGKKVIGVGRKRHGWVGGRR